MSAPYDPVWFSTAELSPQRRQAAAATVLAGLLGEVQVEFARALRRPVRMVHCALPGALITTCIELKARIRSGGGGADIVLARPVGGALRVRQSGRETVVTERSAALIALGRPFDLDTTGAERFDFLRMAAPAVTHADTLHARLGQPAPATDNRLLLLTHYAGALLQGMIPLETERHARLAGNHLRDLAGTLFGLDDPAQGTLTPELRLAAIKEEVDRDYARRDLSVETVASAHGVTPRYVQKLFAREGTTFTRYLLDRRLEAARAALGAADAAKVSAVAFDAGFGDLSYFIRTFRRRFGVTPSQAARPSR